MKWSISRESLALFLICFVDAMLTIVLVATGRATEANPLMARCLERGYWFFFTFKMSTAAVAIIVAELHRRRNPIFVKRLMQTATTAYVGIYLTALLVVNLA